MHIQTRITFTNLITVLYAGSTGRFRRSFLEELFHIRGGKSFNTWEAVLTVLQFFPFFSFHGNGISISILHGTETCERHGACA